MSRMEATAAPLKAAEIEKTASALTGVDEQADRIEAAREYLADRLRIFQNGGWFIDEVILSEISRLWPDAKCSLSNLGFPDGGDSRMIVDVQGEYCERVRGLLPSEIEVRLMTQSEYEHWVQCPRRDSRR